MDDGPHAGRICRLIVFLLDVAWYLPALILSGYYCKSLRYEIRNDKVIVHVGIWTKSVKHEPFRTVTNLKINRDIFDRGLFGIGSLNIQTAGMSGKSGAEESLVGLPNVQYVYEIVGTRLRQYRGAMAPTASEVESEPGGSRLEATLAELRAIRKALEK